jgi:hypothetical protein
MAKSIPEQTAPVLPAQTSATSPDTATPVEEVSTPPTVPAAAPTAPAEVVTPPASQPSVGTSPAAVPPLPTPAPTPVPVSASAPAMPPKKNSWLIALIVIFVVVLCICIPIAAIIYTASRQAEQQALEDALASELTDNTDINSNDTTDDSTDGTTDDDTDDDTDDTTDDTNDNTDNNGLPYDPAAIGTAIDHFNFIYVGTPPTPEYANYTMAAFGEHYEEVLDRFDISSMPVIDVEIYTDATLFGGSVPVTVTDYWVGGYAYYSGYISILLDSRSTAFPYAGIEFTVVHEIAHLASYNRFGGLISPMIPRWMLEGLADYSTYEIWNRDYYHYNPPLLDPSDTMATLPSLETAVISTDLTTRGNGYAVAYAFTESLINTYGKTAIFQMIDSLEDTGIDYDFAKAFRHVTGDNLNAVYTAFYNEKVAIATESEIPFEPADFRFNFNYR